LYWFYGAVNYLLSHQQKIKALLENVGFSMCRDHSDWDVNCSLDAQSPNPCKSLVTYFLEAHPTENATKKLQVSSFLFVLVQQYSFLTIAVDNRHIYMVDVL
jgi:hypothetical protein